MERVILVIILGLLAFIALQMTRKVDYISDEGEYFGEVEKGDCESCGLTSLEPQRVCPSGMCSMNGRIGCKV